MSAPRLSKADYAKLSSAGKAKLAGAAKAVRKVAKRASKPRAVKKPRKSGVRVAKSAPASAGASDSPWHKGLATGAGTLIGGALGGPAGAAIGGAAGKLFSAITGFGDYTIKENSILSGTSPPMFESGQRVNVIEHREFIGDVLGSIAFQNTSFSINPGLFASFPWLAQVAANYEQYHINGMVYEFKSTAGDAVSSTNNAMGTVIMATEYNSLNPAFTSKAEMENYQFCTSAKPSVSFLHPIECAKSESTLTELYMRTGEVPSGADKRFYDFGNFQIATQGMQANGITVGELWVTYSVTLIKPRIPSALSQLPLQDHYSWNADELATVSTGAPLGSGHTALIPKLPTSGSTIASRIISGTVIQLPGYPSQPAPFITDDRFMIFMSVRGPGGTTYTNHISYTLGAAFTEFKGLDQAASSESFLANTTVTNDSWSMRMFYRNSTAGANITDFQLTVSGTMPAGGTENLDLYIIQLNPGTSPLLKPTMGQIGKGVLRVGMKDTSAYRAELKEEASDSDDDEVALRSLARVLRKVMREESKEPIEDFDDGDAPLVLKRSVTKKEIVRVDPPVPETPKKASRK